MSMLWNTHTELPAPTTETRAAPATPQAGAMSRREMQAYLRRLEVEERQIGGRNRYMVVALAAAMVVLGAALWGVYRSTIREYAHIDNLRIEPHPADPGLIEIKFRVVSPGKVHYRGTSGENQTDLVDHFLVVGQAERSWPLVHEPGKDVEIRVWYRGRLWQRSVARRFSEE